MPQDKAQFTCVDIRVIDEESKLYYCLSRYYSPELCRWISPDSIDYLDYESISGLNLFAYCGNNPIMYVDSSGHAWYWYHLAIEVFKGTNIISNRNHRVAVLQKYKITYVNVYYV